MEWRIYYGDKSTFSDEDGLPQDAPAWNVQAIIQRSIESGRAVVCLQDYYIFDRQWFGVDIAGVTDYMLNKGLLKDNGVGRKLVKVDGEWIEVDSFDLILYMTKIGVVKIGRILSKEEFYNIYRLADADEDFPRRTAYGSDEWRPGDNT